MIIQLLLCVALALIFIYAVSQRRRAFLPALSMAAVALAGGVLVLLPQLANDIAHVVGVGRGADLVLYCLAVLTLAAVLNIHLRLRSDREVVTELARRLAIQSAKVRDEG
ncbi:DUF2304 family protein [Devosia albogilva]|uniref:DUF2304 family protein n=1 Tax=Devosia albogilva TaxID=429726 RepID=A0ABW5QFH2_9HYPH